LYRSFSDIETFIMEFEVLFSYVSIRHLTIHTTNKFSYLPRKRVTLHFLPEFAMLVFMGSYFIKPDVNNVQNEDGETHQQIPV
jgi:hypothetical protein